MSLSGGIYISFGIYLSSPKFYVLFVTVSKLFCGEILETFVILSAILFPVKSPFASAVFWVPFFEAVLSVSVAFLVVCEAADCLG